MLQVKRSAAQRGYGAANAAPLGRVLRTTFVRSAIGQQVKCWTRSRNWSYPICQVLAALSRCGLKAPPGVYFRLAQVCRRSGNIASGTGFLELGRSQHTSVCALEVQWAELASAAHDWDGAVDRWGSVIDEFADNSPVAAFARLSQALRSLERFAEALAIVDRGLVLYPDDLRLLTERAEIATAQHDWLTAKERWGYLLDQFGDAAPPRLFLRLVRLHRRRRDFATAEATCLRAMAHYPDEVDLAIEHAEIATGERNWPVVVERWGRVLERWGRTVPPRVHVRLARTYRVLGNVSAADEAIAHGIKLYPMNVALALERAEIAMVRRDWVVARGRWQRVLEVAAGNGPRKFPAKSALLDWFECDWHLLAAAWLGSGGEASEPYSPELYQRVAELIAAQGYYDEAEALLLRGLTRHTYDASTAVRYAESAMARHHWLEAIERWRMLIDKHGPKLPPRVFEALLIALHAADNDAPVAEVCRRARGRYPYLSGLTAELAKNRDVLASFSRPRHRLGEIELYLIRHHPGTILSEQLRSGVYITRDDITEQINRIDRLGAIDSTGAMRFVKRLARVMAGRYARAFARPPYLPAEVLAEAMHFHFLTELGTLIPLRHVARRIAARHPGEPLFVDLPRTDIFCLNYWTANSVEPLLLYTELRRIGANAFLCLEDHNDPTKAPEEPTVLRFSVSPSWERTASLPLTHDRRSRSALVPAGVRSLDRVVEELEGAHVLPAAQIINPLPYTVRFASTKVEFTDTIYPQQMQPEVVEIAFTPGPLLESRCLEGSPLRARVEVARSVDLDLLSNLDRMVGRVVEEMAHTAVALVKRDHIDDLHICDHMFLESVLMTHAVKQASGKVTLWPHSTNPVDYAARDRSQVDAVVAITRTGQDMWREALPGVSVELRSDLMLPPSSPPVAPVPGKPLTVIIIGGGSMIGRLPVVPLTRHRKSYRSLLRGLAGLGHAVDIVFKPKGTWLESASWLHRVVNGQVPFHVCLDHPSQVDYPNMLFVSVSFATSALLEGISRGIPALIVRDFPVEDYTTIDTGVIHAGKTDEIIDEIRSCVDPDYRLRLIERQMQYYRTETSYTD